MPLNTYYVEVGLFVSADSKEAAEATALKLVKAGNAEVVSVTRTD